MSTIYKVEGMTCGGCASSVTRAIQTVEPKAKVMVDLAAKTVTVIDGPEEAKVKTAVEDAGFDYAGTAAS